MLDRTDVTTSTLAFILFKAMKDYSEGELLNWLEDDDWIVRHAAAVELHIKGGAVAFGRLEILSKSIRHEHRAAAALVLGQLGTPVCPFAAKSFPILLRLAQDHYHEVRASAFDAVGSLASLGHQPPHDLVMLMSKSCSDERSEVREALAEAMMPLSSVVADMSLEQLLNDDDTIVSNAAEYSIRARHNG